MDPIDLQIILHAVDEASHTVKEVENATASLGETAKVASEHAGKLGEAFSGLLQGVAVGVGITAAADAINSLGEAIPKAIEEVTTFGQEVLRMDRQTGASAETSSALLAVFERYGVSADQASRSLGLFAKNLNTYADSSLAAQSKSTGFAGAIDSLGIHVKDANGNLIPMSEQLLNVADKFQAMPDGVEKTADAMALFGRSGKDMILVLNQGRDGMQEAMDTAAKYGLVLSGDTIEQVRQFGLAHKDLDEAMKGVTLQIGVAVIPLLAKLAEGAAGLAQGFNETVMPAIKGFGDALDKFTASEAFQMWSARLLVVIGLIGDGIGALSGVFFNALGGILDVVNTVGQAIYQGLQWLNPFAAHSPPLVSQVQDGVAAINTAYGSLSGLTATFDGIGTSFEALGTKTADFSSTVDDVATKTEKALAVMGPGVTDAFNTASDAVEAAKGNLADIKSAWDDATAALVPLKDNLDAAKEGLRDQQSALSDLKGELTGAQAAYDPLNNALKDATQNAKNAQSAIQALTSAPIAGSAAFDTKIADANIAIKQQSLALNDIKQSSVYQSLGTQIDDATSKLKTMQAAQAAAPLAVAGASPAARAAAATAANQARAAVQQQSAAVATLKAAQADLLTAAQKKLTLDQDTLATINLQKDATIGVAQIQIKQAGQAASGITEKTPTEILAGLSTAGADRVAANAQVATLTPEVASALANVDAMKAKIAEQTLAVQGAQAATTAANTTYTDAKTKVDDLGKAYRDTKAEIAGYDAQLKQTIATGDMQVQKIKAAEAAAKSAAAAAGKAHSAPGVADDTGAESISKNLGEAKQKAEDFSKAVDQAKQDVAAFFQPVSDAADALGKFLAPLGDLGHWLTMAGVAFAVFTVAAGPVGAILGMIGAALALLLSPIGLIVLGVAALGIAIATNFGGIRTILQPAVDMFVVLQDRLKDLADVLTTAFQTGGFEGLVAAVKEMLPGILDELGAFTVDLVKWALDVGDQLAAHVLLWAGAFLDWIVPLIPQVITALFALSLKIIDWISSAGSMLAEHLGKWAAEFVAWIIPLLPKLGVALERITGATIDFIFAATPKVLGALASWAGAFLGWVLPALPGLLAAVGALVIGLTVWLVTVAVPKIAAGLVEWGKAFVEWVSPLIPPLLVELGTLALEFLKWIADRVPELVAGFLDWATSFIAWISPMIVPFLAELETLAVAVLGWIGDKSKDLVLKLLEWGAAFISWIAPQVVPFLDELAKLSIALIGWIVDRATEIGDKIATEWGPAFLGWIAGTVVPGLAAALAAILDAILAWITGTALPWIAANLAQLGTGIIDAIGAGFSGLGAVLRGIWEGVEADLGAGIHYSGTKGLTWTGPTLSIPMPSLPSWPGGGGTAPAGGAGSGTVVPVGGGGLPTVGGGAPIYQNGPVSGVPNTTPNQDDAIRNPSIVASAARRVGATPSDVAQSICGPEAYAALSAALGHSVTIDEAIAYSSQAGWSTAGMGGPGNMTKLLAQQNIPAVQTDIDTARKAVAGGGYSAVISTPGHYLESDSTDPNSGKFNVGDSGTVIGAGTQVSAGDLLNNKHAGPITGVWLVKTSGGDAPSVTVADTVNAASDLVAPGGNYDPSSFGGQKGASDGTNALISKTVLDAKNYADQLGISIDDANKILLDHGHVAQTIFGTQLPAAADISDLAVEKFADRMGVNWDTARAALTAGGAAADAVMGTGIPDDARASSNAVAALGNNKLWDPIISNAALAGKDLKEYVGSTGAQAIDVATASLADLEKASGLSLPQMQREADAAGKDLKTWLQETGVPAAQSLAGALDKMGDSAGGTVGPLNDANAAAGNLSKTFITGNPAIDSFSAALAKIPDQAKAAAQSYRDLVTAMDNNLASSGPGGSLRQAASVAADIGVHSVMDASGNISTLSKPYASMTEDQKAAANRFSLSYPNGLSGSGGGGGGNPSPSGSGGGGSSSSSSSASPFGSSTIGSSGPGGKYNNPATGQPYTHAAGGPIYPNKPYLVGEQGPELIVPSHAGMVNPAGVTAALNTAMSNLPKDLARTSAVLDHLRDTFKAIPSNEQITVHLNTLDAQRNLKSLNDQVASTIAPKGDASGTAAAQHMHVARSGGSSSAQATGSIDYDRLAEKIGDRVAKAVLAAPAPRVHVEEIRSKLINIGARNGGMVGLA